MKDFPVTIRPAVAGDASTIAAFQLQMARESESLELDPRIVSQGVAAVFSDPMRGQYYVAEVDGQPAGCLLTVPEWSDWRNGTVLWIHSVFVAIEFRRRGVYRALYEYLREKVNRDPSLRGLRLYVDKTNLPAQKTYAALGMNGEHYYLYEWLKRP